MTRERTIDLTFLLLRVVAAFMFVQTGGMKLLGWLGGIPPTGGPAPIYTQAWAGGLIEVVGGILIAFGLLTRPVAFILSGEMAVAYWQFHFKAADPWPSHNQGMAAVLYCFLFLFLAANGAGAWSLDALFAKKRRAPQISGQASHAH